MLWFLRGRAGSAPTNQKSNAPPTQERFKFRGRDVQVYRRAYKRSLGLTLQVNGRIRVSAPKSTPLARIEKFLLSHSDWIDANLAKYQELRENYPKKVFSEGEVFLFLGSEVQLHYKLGVASEPHVDVIHSMLVVFVPREMFTNFNGLEPHPEFADLIIDFFKAESRRILTDRLLLYSDRMNVKPSAVSFRSQKTRWGSCTVQGKISLNWRLIVARMEVVDYVVIHELAHLKFHNHSAAFWALVASQMSDYKEHRRWLREHQFEADFLAKRSELHS
jgi:predicted metal-dependent hydrolase